MGYRVSIPIGLINRRGVRMRSRTVRVEVVVSKVRSLVGSSLTSVRCGRGSEEYRSVV